LFASLDRPMQVTLNSVRVKTALADDLRAELYIKDDAMRAGEPSPAGWLSPNEQGGGVGRYVKKFEKALIAQGAMPAGMLVVPGPAARLDGFGNISRGQIVQVLNQLGAELSPGYRRVISANGAKRLASAKRSGRLYVAIAKKVGNLRPGVYVRGGRGMRELRLVFAYVSRVSYSKRLALQETTVQRAPLVLDRQLARAIAESRQRLTARGST